MPALLFLRAAIALGASATIALAQWGPVPTSNTPSPRSEALLFHDLLGNRMLMFGGNITNEFWSLQDGQWTQLAPSLLPSPRRRMNAAIGTFTGEIWMYGGQGGSASSLDELWQWTGTTWQVVTPTAGSTPGGLIWHGMAFDDLLQRSVVFGGRRDIFNPNQYLDETWVFDGTSWSQPPTQYSPPPALQPAMAYHPTLGQVMLFGGETGQGTASDETWLFDGANWTHVNLTGPRPPARTGARLMQNLSRGIVVLCGGRDPLTFEILNDTWEHDGTGWRQVDNVYGGVYPPRIDAAVAHDFIRDRIVLFGGQIQNGALRNDTWEYGAHWQPFGSGCAGSAGTPQFVGVDAPRLGTTASAQVSNVPPAIPFALVAVGLSRTQWALGSLPTLLTPIGMPGCRAYTSSDLIVVVPATAGVATWTWDVPNQQVFVGETFHLQGITFDPGVNAMGLAVSNAATLVVGN